MYLKKFLRVLSLCMIPAMLLGGCGGVGSTEPSTQPVPTEDPYKNAYHKTDPADDDTLYILTAAASNSYYFLDELYGMLEAVGIKAKVCSLYKGSTGINQYHQYWKNNENVFQLIVHDENGVTTLEGMNLDMALKYYNFDVYNMQDGNAPHRQGKTPQQAADERALAHKEIIEHIREKCPFTKQFYQEIFALDIGFNQSGFQMSSREQQIAYQKSIRDFTEIVCRDFDLGLIPCGRAWDIAREDPMCGKMCGRLAINNGEGDYLHDGDIGGGQYLNACVWFETLTGQSCVGNTFRPEYALSEEMITVLQNAAHQAVQELNNT